METKNEAASAPSALELRQPAISAALPNDVVEEGWLDYGNVPIRLAVCFPLQEITLSCLSELKPGAILKSVWPAAEDVLISTGDVFLANGCFEPLGTTLGVRISSFAPRSVREAKRSSNGDVPNPNDEGKSVSHSLKDLWLSLSVCVGTAQVPLHEVLQWTTGDILSLDRPVNAPVNILLKERVVGSGNLVLNGGCYAVQLTDIAPRSRRLPHCWT